MSAGGPAQETVRSLEEKIDAAIQSLMDAKSELNAIVGHVAALQQQAAGKSIYEP